MTVKLKLKFYAHTLILNTGPYLYFNYIKTKI